MIGGDLYVVQDTPHGVRVLVGDVRGKGLGAVSAVCADLGAFRYAADEAEDLPRVVDALEWALPREGGRRGGYTDGVTEARDENGVFYDAAVRPPHLLPHRSLVGDPPAPAQILQLLIDDVGRHTGGRIQDDQALLALHRPAGATGPVLRPPRV